jgi:MOSC domain-containing protein YiiM
MVEARIVGVSMGRGETAPWAGRMKRTAINKRPVAATVLVGALGLTGDEQVDKIAHGGPDQAVYAYAREDLDWWAARLGRELRNGMFGENITTAGLDVTNSVIGETWRFGRVVVQVTSPRVPCLTFRNWVEEKGWIKTFRAAGRPGAYLRVLQPGSLREGDPVELVSRPDDSITVADVLEALYRKDVEVLRRMIELPGHNQRFESLPAQWLAAAAAPRAGAPQAGTQAR